MCGIWGWLQRDGRPALDESTIRRQTEAMQRRGPDDFGSYRSEAGAALGFRRLSIIDLESGHQPITNEDGSVVVVFNGEIYNFRPLRERLQGLGHRFATQSDSEVIAHGYEQWGESVFEELCGMFAIAIWDEKARKLVLARDRLGIKPVYFADRPGAFGFSSDPRTLVGLPGVSAEIDREALALFLYYGFVPAPWSIYRDVRKLRPGHLCVVTEAGCQVRRYWQLAYEPVDRSPRQHVEAFSQLFASVVDQHLIADVPLGSFLSGGMDSTAIVQAATASIAASGGSPLQTFNVAFSDPDANEAGWARQAADTLGTDHHEFPLESNPADRIVDTLSCFPEPFGDSAAVPAFLLSGLIRQHCTVALSGDGGDEVFGGYSLRTAQAIAALQRAPAWLRRIGRATPGPLGNLCERSFEDRAVYYGSSRARMGADQVDRLLGGDRVGIDAIEQHTQLMRDDLAQSGVRGILDPFLYLDQSFGLPDQMLSKVDFASMGHSLEVRVPFLDHRIVEFAAGLPLEMKQKGFGEQRTKRIVRQFLLQRFPDSFVHRPKKGFGMPLHGDLSERLATDLDTTGSTPPKRLPDAIDRNALDGLLAGRVLGNNAMWSLSALSIWKEHVATNTA